jgi:hypothetical protein
MTIANAFVRKPNGAESHHVICSRLSRDHLPTHIILLSDAPCPRRIRPPTPAPLSLTSPTSHPPASPSLSSKTPYPYRWRPYRTPDRVVVSLVPPRRLGKLSMSVYERRVSASYRTNTGRMTHCPMDEEQPRLTENRSLLPFPPSRLQHTRDRPLMLLAAKLDIHRFGQIKRSHEKHIHPVHRSDRFDVVCSLTGFDLDDDEERRVAFLFIRRRRRVENVMCERRSTASGSERGEFTSRDDSSCRFLPRSPQEPPQPDDQPRQVSGSPTLINHPLDSQHHDTSASSLHELPNPKPA